MRYAARVMPGRGEGRKLGFPTLNLEIPAELGLEYGIYAGWAWLGSEGPLPAAVHYGPVPVFGIPKPSLEVHLINKELGAAPAEVSLEIGERLREIRDFKDKEALAAQMRLDVQAALTTLRKIGPPSTGQK